MAKKEKAPPTSEQLKSATREELVEMYEDVLTALTFFAVAVAQHPKTERALDEQLFHAIATATTPEGRQHSLVAALLCRSSLATVKEKIAVKLAAAQS